FPPDRPGVWTPEQMGPMAPQVIWAGEQLTIVTNNSALGAVLNAVREKTGAYIDIPAAASNDRIAAQLGPGPAREVLSTLLGGTEFDYVIQASDDNPAGIQNIFLTKRGKPGNSKGDVLASQPRRYKYQRFNGARLRD